MWGRGTPIYVLDRHEPPDRVWFHPGGGGGGRYSFIWPIRGCAAEQEIVFYLSVLTGFIISYESVRNRVHV